MRIRALLPPDAEVLDFGAGRGKFGLIDPPTIRQYTDIKPLTSRFAAFDVDEAVLENIETEDRHFSPIGRPLPFEDNSFDLIYCTWVAEHIADPEFYVSELERILKPGGWFCAMTPNKWGIIGIGGRLVPNSMHVKFLKTLAPQRDEIDTFPTCYKMNTRSDVSRLFKGWANGTFYFNGDISYHGNKLILARFWQLVERILPQKMSKLLAIFVQKPPAR